MGLSFYLLSSVTNIVQSAQLYCKESDAMLCSDTLLSMWMLLCGANFWAQKKGKLLISHRSTIYPCFLPDLGEFNGSWSYKTYPAAKVINVT